MTAQEQDFSTEVLEISDRIKPLLAGRSPQVQSAVLAELLGLLLAGHWIPGDPDQTSDVRAAIFAAHCTLVLKLTEASAKILGTDQ